MELEDLQYQLEDIAVDLDEARDKNVDLQDKYNACVKELEVRAVTSMLCAWTLAELC